GPALAHLVRSEDEVGASRQRLDEGAGGGCGLQGGVAQVEAALRRRVDDRALDRVEGALRERREGPHGLDRVAEQLDAERLVAGRRVDVDDAAADGELAALVDPLDALVAGERELLRQAVDPRLARCAQFDWRRARPG